VGVVTIVTLVLNVCRRDRDAALFLLRRIINLVITAAITFVSAAVSAVLP
jgi:hypothetical protein